MKARDFIKPGEEILILKTDGTLLEFGKDNTAITGDWDISANHSTDRVIIYLTKDSTTTLYIGNRSGVVHVIDDKYKVILNHVQYIGKTELNWKDFAETDRNPVRYLYKN